MVAPLHAAAEHLSVANPDIPAAVGDVVARALSKRPEDRYRTCARFADALRNAMLEMGIRAYLLVARPPPPGHAGARKRGRTT